MKLRPGIVIARVSRVVVYFVLFSENRKNKNKTGDKGNNKEKKCRIVAKFLGQKCFDLSPL